jgi:putative transposase
VRVRRPRVRSADGTGEVAVPTYQVFASTELLGQLALERMLAKLSARRYPAGLEPVGTDVASTALGTPSRRSPAGSSPEPSTPWPSCSPRT